jgi:hypothetical protein
MRIFIENQTLLVIELTNQLAYYATERITTVNSFIGFAPGALFITLHILRNLRIDPIG